MNTAELKEYINSERFDRDAAALYPGCAGVFDAQKKRWLDAVDAFVGLYGADRDVSAFSVGGRSEISGNHTDHNHGEVVAAAVDLDIIAVASKRDDSIVTVKSAGFPADSVDVAAYTEPKKSDFYTSGAIIAGVADGLRKSGFSAGGFDAYTTSDVLGGSGLSSSAAFEDMIGNIENHFYNEGKIPSPKIAMISQYAENVFFGKPCGLMDQTACAVGGFVAIDFEKPGEPKIQPLSFDLNAAGYALCIVSAGGSHADLNEDYASIPAEMKAVAAELGQEVLRGISADRVISEMSSLREKCGDRAVLRALHFISENDRVERQTEALRSGDLDTFLDLVRASGDSSFRYLQNIYTTKKVDEQSMSLALCLSERYLSGMKAAWRVHGGGFAGTIQAFVPKAEVEGYRKYMDGVFGEGACKVLSVRSAGAVKLA